MPARRTSAADTDAIAVPRGNFRRRYDDVENKRAELIARLHRLGDTAQAHPGYNRALKLLNDTFRKSRLAQRLAVLQAATWLIDILERLATAL
jgi:predicted RNA polymerase sigma factor